MSWLSGYSFRKQMTVAGQRIFIPTSVTDECNGGVVTASGENPPNETAVKAFDNNFTGSKWLVAANTGWIKYDFGAGNGKAIDAYSITSGNDAAERDPYNWTLEGSNDNTNWTVLDTREDETWASRLLTHYFGFLNSTAYRYIRLNISRVYTPSSNLLQIEEIQFAVSYAGATNTDAPATTNYPHKITVHKSAGTDTLTDVYLGTSVKDDFSDVHFTAADGSTELSYYIESSVSGSYAVMWVKLDTLPAYGSTQVFYVYYGNAGASSASSGSGTFLLFENMLSTPGGTLAGDATYDNANHWVQLTPATNSKAGRLYYTLTQPAGIRVHWTHKINGSADALFLFVKASSLQTGEDDNNGGFNFVSDEYQGQIQLKYQGGNLLATALAGIGGNNWVVNEATLRVTDSTHRRLKYNYNSSSLYIYDTTNIPNYTYFGFGARTGGLNAQHLLGAFYVREYVYPEPKITAWGEEEQALILAGYTGQTLRNIKNTAAYSGQTKRMVVSLAGYIGQTKRLIGWSADFTGQLKRAITSPAEYIAQTQRWIGLVAAYIAQTYREAKTAASFSGQTERRVMGLERVLRISSAVIHALGITALFSVVSAISSIISALGADLAVDSSIDTGLAIAGSVHANCQIDSLCSTGLSISSTLEAH